MISNKPYYIGEFSGSEEHNNMPITITLTMTEDKFKVTQVGEFKNDEVSGTVQITVDSKYSVKETDKSDMYDIMLSDVNVSFEPSESLKDIFTDEIIDEIIQESIESIKKVIDDEGVNITKKDKDTVQVKLGHDTVTLKRN